MKDYFKDNKKAKSKQTIRPFVYQKQQDCNASALLRVLSLAKQKLGKEVILRRAAQPFPGDFRYQTCQKQQTD